MKHFHTYKLSTIAIVLSLLSACGSKDTVDTKPVTQAPEIADQLTVTDTLIEIPTTLPTTPPIENPATALKIPGADKAHLKEAIELERKNTISLQEIQAIFYFGFDQVMLTTLAEQELKAISPELKNLPGTIMIEGHTDNRGKPAYNKALGLRRAKSVANYLNKQGINLVRLQVSSAGSEQPVAKGSDESSRAKNRRVELTLQSSGR